MVITHWNLLSKVLLDNFHLWWIRCIFLMLFTVRQMELMSQVFILLLNLIELVFELNELMMLIICTLRLQEFLEFLLFTLEILVLYLEEIVCIY